MLTDSEKVAYEFLVMRGNKVAKNNRSPDFIGDGTFEVKRVYFDKYDQRHVVLSRKQFQTMIQSYPRTNFLFVEPNGRIEEVPLSEIKFGEPLLKANGIGYVVHWQPSTFTDALVHKVILDERGAQMVQAIKTVTGVHETSSVFQMSLKLYYDTYVGSPLPNGKKK